MACGGIKGGTAYDATDEFGHTVVEKSDRPVFRIVDTNVSLFRWPYPRLPLDETSALVDKVRSLGIACAWAGNPMNK